MSELARAASAVCVTAILLAPFPAAATERQRLSDELGHRALTAAPATLEPRGEPSASRPSHRTAARGQGGAPASVDERVARIRDRHMTQLLGDRSPVEGTAMTAGSILRATFLGYTRGIPFPPDWRFPKSDRERAEFVTEAGAAVRWYSGMPVKAKKWLTAYFVLAQQEAMRAVPKQLHGPRALQSAGRSFLQRLAAAFLPSFGSAAEAIARSEWMNSRRDSYDADDERKLAAVNEIRVGAFVAAQLRGELPAELDATITRSALRSQAETLRDDALGLLYLSDWEDVNEGMGRRSVEAMGGAPLPEYPAANPEERMRMTRSAYQKLVARIDTIGASPAVDDAEFRFLKLVTFGQGLSPESYVRRHLGDRGVERWSAAPDALGKARVEIDAGIRAFAAQWGVIFALGSTNEDQ